MAMMINCATDWTYDLFEEDSRLYKATPIKGVYPRRNAEYREYFMVMFKGYVRDFVAKWNAEHDGHQYDRYDGWIGDAFARQPMFHNGFFSDFYKDAYGQRPHLSLWFYIHLMGLPMSEDTARTFCARPVEDAIKNAKYVRDYAA